MSVVQMVKIVGLGAVALTLSVEWLDWLFCRLWPRKISRGPLKEVFFFPTEVACTERLFTPDSPL